MKPTLAVLVAYAEAANCYLEVLARDDLSLGPGRSRTGRSTTARRRGIRSGRRRRRPDNDQPFAVPIKDGATE